MSDVDIAVVGFGPASAGFLTVMAEQAAGMPLQIVCYERADDIGFGVSGVVTRRRGIDLDLSQIPMATPVREERVVYLRNVTTAIELPFIPPFLRKQGGADPRSAAPALMPARVSSAYILSLGQFLTHVGGNLMASGAVQIWPGTPIEQLLQEDNRVTGVRMTAGMEMRADLTVVADGPVGACGQQLNRTPPREWAVGMKMVVDLPETSGLQQGTVIHTFGYPEPEIFGFLYVHPNNVASAGIFVPSWMQAPAETSYRYLQHFIRHPYIWQYLKGGKLRSWGAKSLQESGRRAEPQLAGDGWARIGEGSGSTNVLTGSGVDEAWSTGAQLAEGVLELLRAGKPFDRASLENAYVARRRASWVDRESRIAEHARDGFHRGLFPGLIGMALAGFTNGRLHLNPKPAARPPRRTSLPDIPYDGQLLVSHQDALLLGGKVQAPPGFDDHVTFADRSLCESCAEKLCVQMCSGQALTRGDTAVPTFDREKCVHCGACLWNCRKGALVFRAGAGGLHSNEN